MVTQSFIEKFQEDADNSILSYKKRTRRNRADRKPTSSKKQPKTHHQLARECPFVEPEED